MRKIRIKGNAEVFSVVFMLSVITTDEKSMKKLNSKSGELLIVHSDSNQILPLTNITQVFF